MFSFIYNLFCGNTDTRDKIEHLKKDLEPKDNYIIQKYLSTLDYNYNLLKLRRKITKSLRFFQFLGGFAITTLTTYNNPYFKDNTEKINIIVWYFSISNNIFNLLIEKMNTYNLTIDKMKIYLLIREGELLLDNKEDYRYYEEDDLDKIKYFKECYTTIQTNEPYNYLTNNIEHEKEEINNSRKRRLARVWAVPVPTPPANIGENV